MFGQKWIVLVDDSPAVSDEKSQAHDGAGDAECHDGRKVSLVGKSSEVGDEEQLENARKRYGDDERHVIECRVPVCVEAQGGTAGYDDPREQAVGGDFLL